MNWRLNHRSFRSKKLPGEAEDSNSNGISPQLGKGRRTVSSQGLERREFLKLTALAAGGGLAAVFLSGALKPLGFVSKATNQLLEAPGQVTPRIGLMVPVADSALTVLDPTTIPKFENELVGPPPCFPA